MSLFSDSEAWTLGLPKGGKGQTTWRETVQMMSMRLEAKDEAPSAVFIAVTWYIVLVGSIKSTNS